MLPPLPGGAVTAAKAVSAPRKKGRTALSSEAVMLVSFTAMGPVSWPMPSRSFPYRAERTDSRRPEIYCFFGVFVFGGPREEEEKAT